MYTNFPRAKEMSCLPEIMISPISMPTRKPRFFIPRYAPLGWWRCLSELDGLPAIRIALWRKMQSTENTRSEKCKEREVHRATYSRSIKKFPGRNFSLQKLTKVHALARFPQIPSLSIATTSTTTFSKRLYEVIIDAHGWRVNRGFEFDRWKKNGKKWEKMRKKKKKDGKAVQKFRVRM